MGTDSTKRINMKYSTCFFVLFALLWSKRLYAYDIAVENADGVTIYYNYINDAKELEVTSSGSNASEYKGNVVIPEEVTYMNRTRNVTSIGGAAFVDCKSLTSVTIPNSVTTINSFAFSRCTSLTSITIPNSVTSIGYEAFWNCSSLTSIMIPNSVTSIGAEAFLNCSSLTSVTIGNSVTSIGREAFEDCKSLTSVTIGNSVTTINSFAFSRCTSLTSITIPNSVTSIGDEAFVDCKSLTSVTIGNSVTEIEWGAFWNCSSLTSITIPNSVTSIGGSVFQDCKSLTSVTIPNSVISIGNRAFSGIDLPIVISQIENPFKIDGKSSLFSTFSKNTFNNATLYVPKGSIDKYKSTEGWKDFLFIEEGLPTEIRDVVGNKTTENRRYTINGEIITTPQKGINIIKMSDGTTKKVLIK